MLDPKIALPLWRGRYAVHRKIILSNLFNHRQTPIERGWSVKKTQVEDFRGRDSTYDSHNGTDLCVPIGTPLLAPASGVVVRVVSEFHRGGLKLAIDHGEGLITSCAHLTRVLVGEGEFVRRGQIVGITGYSGLDALVTFPWGIPHVHFNVWLDGAPVDPFARVARPEEKSLFLGGWPAPIPPGEASESPTPTVYDEARLDAIVESCVTRAVRARLSAIDSPVLRGGALIFERCYYPTRFRDHGNPCRESHARRPRLHLPFSAEHFDGVVFRDET